MRNDLGQRWIDFVEIEKFRAVERHIGEVTLAR
jgi:hypothetical protein